MNTISLTTCTGERCFSSSRRIKDYLRNTLNENKLNSLAVLSCNKKITQEFPSFKDEVINHFINSKNRKLKLKYKWLIFLEALSNIKLIFLHIFIHIPYRILLFVC